MDKLKTIILKKGDTEINQGGGAKYARSATFFAPSGAAWGRGKS